MQGSGLEDVFSRLDPKIRKLVGSADAVKIQRQRTPSLGMNVALRGGLAYGRQILIWGNK